MSMSMSMNMAMNMNMNVNMNMNMNTSMSMNMNTEQSRNARECEQRRSVRDGPTSPHQGSRLVQQVAAAEAIRAQRCSV